MCALVESGDPFAQRSWGQAGPAAGPWSSAADPLPPEEPDAPDAPEEPDAPDASDDPPDIQSRTLVAPAPTPPPTRRNRDMRGSSERANASRYESAAALASADSEPERS